MILTEDIGPTFLAIENIGLVYLDPFSRFGLFNCFVHYFLFYTLKSEPICFYILKPHFFKSTSGIFVMHRLIKIICGKNTNIIKISESYE